MKRNVLAVMIPVLLTAGTVNAAEVYNKDGNKLELNGKIDGKHTFSKNDGINGDASYARFGFKGETRVNDELTGYGQWEYNLATNKTESQSGNGTTCLAFAGIKTEYGSLDYGRNYGALYDIASYTDVLPASGGDSFAITDNYMNQRAKNLLTYRTNNFFGLVDDLNLALQYQGKNEGNFDLNKLKEKEIDAKNIFKALNLNTENGDGWAVSSTYDTGYGMHFGAGYSVSNRTLAQRELATAPGRRAQAWDVGARYDADNLYVAAVYSETKNMTPYGSGTDATLNIAEKAQNVELVAQYQFDFGLRPSLAYVQSKGKGLSNYYSEGSVDDKHTVKKDVGNKDLLKYISVASYYYFNKNFSTYVDYKINLLKDNDFNKKNGINTKNVIGVGVVYQF